MKSPICSVVMPTHNGERWLCAALQSLAAQDDRDFECIIVDSSASCATLQIAGRFSDRLTIHAHRRPDLPGWQEKTNLGVTLADADYICMLHQDDLWLPDRSRFLRRQLQEHPDGVMHLHPSFIIDEHGRILGIWQCPLPANGSATPQELLVERLLIQQFIAAPAPVIRRDAYLACGGLDSALWYTADWDLYLKLALSGPVYYTATPFTCFRVHSGSLTIAGSRRAEELRAQMETVLDRYAAHAPPRSQEAVMRAARTSIDVNTALAAAYAGHAALLTAAAASVLRLGPSGVWRYLRDSRIVERLLPRLKARLAGAL